LVSGRAADTVSCYDAPEAAQDRSGDNSTVEEWQAGTPVMGEPNAICPAAMIPPHGPAHWVGRLRQATVIWRV